MNLAEVKDLLMKIGKMLLIHLRRLEPEDEFRILIVVSATIDLPEITSEFKSNGVTVLASLDKNRIYAKGTREAIISITKFEWVTLILEARSSIPLTD